MKKLIITITLFLSATFLMITNVNALDITGRSGRVYKNLTSDRVTIYNLGGINNGNYSQTRVGYYPDNIRYLFGPYENWMIYGAETLDEIYHDHHTDNYKFKRCTAGNSSFTSWNSCTNITPLTPNNNWLDFVDFSYYDIRDYNKNILYCGDVESECLTIKISSEYDEENNLALVTIDYSEYLNSDYRYLYGYDYEKMEDVTDIAIDGVVGVPAWYNDIIYAQVVDQNENIVAENSYHISYNELLDQYTYHFHLNGVNGYQDIIKYVNEETDTNYDHTTVPPTFFTVPEETMLFYDRQVAIGFYTDEEMTNEIKFNGGWCPARDLDIYVKWSYKWPLYTPKVYLKDEKIKLQLKFYDWDPLAPEYVVFYHNVGDGPSINYTFRPSNSEMIFDVGYTDAIVLELGYIEDGHVKIISERGFPIFAWVEDHNSQEEIDEMELIYYTNNGQYPTLPTKKFLEILAHPFEFLYKLFEYFISKMNVYVQTFLLVIFSTILISGVIRFIRR